MKQRSALLLIWTIILLAHTLYGQNNIGFIYKSNERYVEIPFELKSNLIVVNVWLNNRLPLRFIVDTGVRTAILTEKRLADILQPEYDRKIQLKAPGDQDYVEAFVTRGISLSIGPIVSESHSVLVLQEDYLRLREFVGENIHGILGYELFSQFVVHIDYDGQRLLIYPPENFREPRFWYRKIPLLIEDTKPYITTSLSVRDEQREAKMMIDTGASQAVLLDRSSNSGMKLPDETIYTSLGRGLGGEITGHIGRINTVSIEDFEFEDAITSFPDPEKYARYVRESDRDGTIGGDILTRFDITLDYNGGFAYFRRNTNYREPFEFDMSGLVLKESFYHPYFEVAYVRDDSPAAEQGIKAGDIILKLNGTDTRYIELGQATEKLRQRDGKKTRLEIRRDEEVKRIIFYLERVI